MNAKAYVFRYFLLKVVSLKFQVGEIMPSEHALAKKLGLSRLTIRSAYSQLVNLGLIKSIHGKGYELAKTPSMILNPLNGLVFDCECSISYKHSHYAIEYKIGDKIQAFTFVYMPMLQNNAVVKSFDDLANNYILSSNLGFDEIILSFNERPCLSMHPDLNFNINIRAYKKHECVFESISFIKPERYVRKMNILKF